MPRAGGKVGNIAISMCFGTAIPETSLMVAQQIRYTNIWSPTLGLKPGTNAWGAYLTYPSGPSYQVLPPSLSFYLLLDPSAWHTLPTILNFSSPGTGQSFPI